MTQDTRSLIVINGSARRSFIFPGPIQDAFQYYQNYHLVFSFLPHILLIHQIGKNNFQLKYEAIEMGLYQVEILCEVTAHLDAANRILYFSTTQKSQPVKIQADVYTITGPGIYTSQSKFMEHGRDTAIHYEMQLYAQLPAPWGLSFIPALIRNRVANSITQRRIAEISDAFISRSIQQYLSDASQIG